LTRAGARAPLHRPPARQQAVASRPATEQAMPERDIEAEFEVCRLPCTAGKTWCCPDALFRRDGVDGHVPSHDVGLTPPDAACFPIHNDRDIDRLNRTAARIDDSTADQVADQGSGWSCMDRHAHAVIGLRHAPVFWAAFRAPGDERDEHEGHRECGRPAHGGGDGNARHLLDSRDHLAPLRSRGSHTLSACHKCRCWCRGRIVKHAYRLYRTRALNGDVTRT